MRVDSKARPMAAVVGLTVAAALAAAGCGGGDGGGGGDNAKVAMLLPETKTTRYEEQDRPNFERHVKEICSGCEVIYSNANQDPAKQQQQAEAAITGGAKAIVISAVDVKSAAAIVKRANQSKIPVIAYGRLIPDADISYYVSIDPFEVGVQQGRALVAELRKNGKQNPSVVMINGSPTDSNAAPYKKGATSVFTKEGVKIVKNFDTPDWSPDKAQQEMEQSITDLGKNGFDGVYVANDGMASGAIAALKGARIDPGGRAVTGQDAELAGVQRILIGDQLMTVYQPIKRIAETAADLAVPLAQGKQPPKGLTDTRVDNGQKQVPSALLDTIVITSGNVQDTVVKDGFLKPGQICSGSYASACKDAGVQ
jgi:D-xylose transport system substrate-binding protein